MNTYNVLLCVYIGMDVRLYWFWISNFKCEYFARAFSHQLEKTVGFFGVFLFREIRINDDVMAFFPQKLQRFKAVREIICLVIFFDKMQLENGTDVITVWFCQ